MNAPLRESRPPSVFLWLLIPGAVGFSAGFVGPMIFAPDANQGPLVGIFISGPGGAFLGLVLYAVLRLARVSASVQWQVMAACSFLLAITTCYFVMPAPAFRGYIVDVRIETCKQPIEAADDAVKYWDAQLARVTSSSPRPGWKDDSRQMLQNDHGVVLGVNILRQRPLFEQRKPWNTGRIVADDWQTVDTHKTFYAQYLGGSCADYATGTRSPQFNDQYFRGVPANSGWPPTEVPNFLDLQTLDSVPDEYRGFIGS